MSKPITIKDRHGKPYAFGQFGTSIPGGNAIPLRNKSELIRVLNQLPSAGRVPQPLAALARTNQPDQLFQAIKQGRIQAWELAPVGELTKGQDIEAKEGEIEQLRDQVKLTLAQIIALERQEFNRIKSSYEQKSLLGKFMAEHKSFFLGTWEAAQSTGTSLFSVAISMQHRAQRLAKATVVASFKQGWDDKFRVFTDYGVNEYKELVKTLGFDPTKIDREMLAEAYHMASLLWDDTPTHYMLLEFGQQYALAQHSTEWASMAGGVAFEILLTAIITALTTGTGTIAVVAGALSRYVDEIVSLGRLFTKLFKILSKRKKLSTPKVTSHKNSAARGSKISDYATDSAPIKPNNPPPAGPTQKTSTKGPDRKPTAYQRNDLIVPDRQTLNIKNREVEVSSPEFNSLDDYFEYKSRYDNPQEFIDSFIADNLSNVNFTYPPKFDPKIISSGKARIGKETLIGEKALVRDSELFKTTVHEEMHQRLKKRADRGCDRAAQIRSDIDYEEWYVEEVAKRYLRMKEKQSGALKH